MAIIFKSGTSEPDSLLDLHDIQGSVVKVYARFGMFKGRYVCFRVNKGNAGRRFVLLMSSLVTNAAPWKTAVPDATTDIAFTYQGLRALRVPVNTLHGFSDAFSMGMRARRDILGDTGPSSSTTWDPIWKCPGGDQSVHIMVQINGKSVAAVEKRYQAVLNAVLDANQKEQQPDGVKLLSGHCDDQRNDLDYQEASLVYKDGQPTPKEHFGYTDGISDTFFKGTRSDPSLVIGGGKPTGGDPTTMAGWAPLETGEFIFGHKDEAFEYPAAPLPTMFSRNGTYLVYRKHHQNVGAFNAFLDEVGAKFPGGKEALAAKFSGRWRNGAPITMFPTEDKANQFAAELAVATEKAQSKNATAADKAKLAELALKLVAFDYTHDLDGANCPRGAHIRRMNPRSSLEFGVKGAFATPGALSNRRRILRRGLPYGEVKDPTKSDGNHGVIIMALNADISRQFEFIQQQWINFGNDFKLANDRDPLLGNHGANAEGRMIIEGSTATGRPPFFCSKIPTMVEIRGGDYFFMPSMTCLQMIGLGLVDPT